MGLIKPGLALAALLMVSGCGSINLTPGEYVPIYAPAITGVVTRDGLPVADLDLVLAPVSSKASNCYFEKLYATTGADGSFRIEPLLASDAGDLADESEYRWQVCIKTDSGKTGIWSDSIFGRLSSNAQTRLACELQGSGNELQAVCKRSDGEKCLDGSISEVCQDWRDQ